eukprot:CAMPEP_0119495082 /NCGR_PEP_ID=MMETSP1344-20130328/18833_1 /TAXON_ID=236787 /ORGANISM="Florenciella parvula, Strain CCMP2471" /LENGTH=52 /DNA_ID=CAMNT_0007530643 /DNA_START=22 /DNA_END=177 /DNA_ORIENTATION=+
MAKIFDAIQKKKNMMSEDVNRFAMTYKLLIDGERVDMTEGSATRAKEVGAYL